MKSQNKVLKSERAVNFAKKDCIWSPVTVVGGVVVRKLTRYDVRVAGFWLQSLWTSYMQEGLPR